MIRSSTALGPSLALLLALTTPVLEASPSADVLTREEQAALTPDGILAELKAGNDRFVRGALTSRDYPAQVQATASGQYPMATILSCLDSRVPVELVFDRGIGDLFVGRVAGNVEDESMIGSFEFATGIAGSKVIVVMGHTACGAVKGTIDREAVAGLGYDNLNDLVEMIEPAVATVLQEGEERSSKNDDLVDRAVRKNVTLTIERIRERSPDLRDMEAKGTIKIVGALYDLSTGKVTWF